MNRLEIDLISDPPVFLSQEEEDYMNSLDTVEKILEHNRKALKEIVELDG